MSGVMMVSQGSGGGVAGRLRGKRCLPRAEVVGAVVDFEGAHTVGERIDTQSYFSVCNFACWVMSGGAESSHSNGGILWSCVQEHLQSAAEETERERISSNCLCLLFLCTWVCAKQTPIPYFYLLLVERNFPLLLIRCSRKSCAILSFAVYLPVAQLSPPQSGGELQTDSRNHSCR